MDIVERSGFYDLNVDANLDKKTFERLIEYGYKTIALNITIDESEYDGKYKKNKSKKDEHDVLPLPSDTLKKIPPDVSQKLRILHRVTVIFSKPGQLNRVINSRYLRKYDVVAVLPKTQQAFQNACGVNCINLISFEVSLTEFKLNRKLYKQVVDRNGYFEIKYAQALRSAFKRQELITAAHFLHIYGKSKNVVISSGASNYLEIRNPYDVANLGLLFGLSEEQGKNAVSKTCRSLILHAYSLKLGKAAVTVEEINEKETVLKKQISKAADVIQEQIDETEPAHKRFKIDTTSNPEP